MLTLTPQARAIAAFTISVLLVAGHLNRIVFGIVLLFGSSYPRGRGGAFLTTLMLIALAAAVTAFAVKATTSVGSTPGWEGHLARAAVAVAVVGILIAVVLGIGVIANDAGGYPGGGFTPYLFAG